jgi:Tol biopolymer transport system component
LFTERRLRGIDISPGGSWIIFYLTFADESTDNGFWVVKPDGSDLHKLDTPGFGAYQWQNDDTLLYIPMRASADESMQLWAINVATGHNFLLNNPDSLSFSIANGDWNVSPDGHHVIFVNSEDQNIWDITLP